MAYVKIAAEMPQKIKYSLDRHLFRKCGEKAQFILESKET